MAKKNPYRTKKWTPKEIERILLLSQDIVSLNTLVGAVDGDADTEIGDLIPDPDPGPDEILLKGERITHVHECLDSAMKPKEAQVLRMRFGIGEYPIMTLEEVGEILGITRERVRQIENRALRKAKIYFTKKKMEFEDV